MKNGHSKARPIDPVLKAAGYWIVQAPSAHGTHHVYYWTKGQNDCGPDCYSFSQAEQSAKAFHKSIYGVTT